MWRGNGTCSTKTWEAHPLASNHFFSDFFLHLSIFDMQSGQSDSDYYGFDQQSYRSQTPEMFHLRARSDLDSNLGDEDDHGDGMVTLRGPRPQLRSRPPINFSGQHSTLSHPPSHLSGSTMRSRSGFSVQDIESLTASELYLNPIHRKLRDKYDHVSGVLATYMERDLEESRVAKRNTPDICQGA